MELLATRALRFNEARITLFMIANTNIILRTDNDTHAAVLKAFLINYNIIDTDIT